MTPQPTAIHLTRQALSVLLRPDPEYAIQVVVGAAGGTPEQLAKAYLAGTLKSGANVCDH